MVLNPERGFRLMLEDFPVLEKLPYARLYNITTCQVYCYLPITTPLPTAFVASLAGGFSRLRAAGVKALLRFAYDSGYNATLNYTWPTVFSHVEQLSPVVRANADVLFALQAGFVGAWGEWHSSLNNLEANASALGQLLAAELEQLLPPDRFVQVRSPAHKAAALRAGGRYGVVDGGSARGGAPFARVGYHNDGFLSWVPGVTPWPASDGMTWYSDAPVGRCGAGVLPLACTADGALVAGDFAVMAHESHWVPTDAEMFPFAGLRTPVIDGHTAASRARDHHHTTLSLSHGLAALDNPYGANPLAEVIDGWMHAPLNATRLGDCGGPPGYPCNLPAPADYVRAPHTVFEYLRDFLGYRVQLTGAEFSVGTDGVAFSGTVVNWGFSAPVSPRAVRLALVDTAGARGVVAAAAIPGADASAWAPHVPHDPLHEALIHTIAGTLPVPPGLPRGNYSLGLWMPDARSEGAPWALRLANEECAEAAAAGPACGVFWWAPAGAEQGGVNLLGVVEVGD